MSDETRRGVMKRLTSVSWTMYKLDFADRFIDPVDHAADVLRAEMNDWRGVRGDMLRDRYDLDDAGHATALRKELLEASKALLSMPDVAEADRRAAMRAEDAADRLYSEYPMGSKEEDC